MKNTVTRQIKYAEDNIKLKKQLGEDATFEKELVKSWIKFRKKHGDSL